MEEYYKFTLIVDSVWFWGFGIEMIFFNYVVIFVFIRMGIISLV